MSAMQIRLATLAVLLCGIVLLGCHGKATNPPNVPATSIHEPWPNEEAEFIAIYLSDQLAAPRQLYDVIDQDLTAIRTKWGDSIPKLLEFRASLPNATSRLVIKVVDDAFLAIKDGTYHDWDSLNELFGVINTVPSPDNSGLMANSNGYDITLDFDFRIHAESLAVAYESLPGVQFARRYWKGYLNFSNLYPRLTEDGRGYLFTESRMDEFQSPYYKHHWYFRSDDLGVHYLGDYEWSKSHAGPLPEWWGEADTSQILFLQAIPEIHDSVAPATVTDLDVVGTDGNSIVLSWTAPGDDGFSGSASSYDIAIREAPIDEFTGTRWGVGPSYSARQQTATVRNLIPNTTYYLAIRTRDEFDNVSDVSNVVTATTTTVPGWTTWHAGSGTFLSDDILTLLSDAAGRLWMIAGDAVSVFDGDVWTNYTPTNSAIPSGILTDLVLDSAGNVWLGTSAGLAHFDGLEWEVYHRGDDGFPGEYTTDLIVAPDGAVWAATAFDIGLARFDGDTWSVIDTTNSDLQTQVGDIAMAVEPFGAYWVATEKGYWRVENGVWETFVDRGGPRATEVETIMAARNGDVYFGSHHWLRFVRRYRLGEWSFLDGATVVGGWYEDPSGTIWAAGTGAMWLDGDEWQCFHVRNSGIASDAVRAITQDQAGIYWFATDRGLSRYDPSQQLLGVRPQ